MLIFVVSEIPRVIVFFDGGCLFCSQGVRWLHWLDPRDRLRFASLQGKTARPFVGLLPALDVGDDSMATLVIKNGKTEVFTHSAGVLEALRVAGGLAGFLAFCLRLIPGFLRDHGYRFLAKRRYFLFGKDDACELLQPELRDKLLG